MTNKANKFPSKFDLITNLIDQWFSKRQASVAVLSIIDFIDKSIREKWWFKVSWIGVLSVKNMDDKYCMDFQSKKSNLVKAHKILKFKSSRTYNKSLNKKCCDSDCCDTKPCCSPCKEESQARCFTADADCKQCTPCKCKK